MNLCSVYDRADTWAMLYELLKEREPHQNISHKVMPDWIEHCAYIKGRPHTAWYAFQAKIMAGGWAGMVYLSKRRELGIGVLREHRGQGLAEEALREIMRRHPGQFLANIAPGNVESRQLFAKLGFKLCQQTYLKETG